MRQATRCTSLMERSNGGCIDALEFIKQSRKKAAGTAILGVGVALLDVQNDDLGLTLLAFGVLILGSIALSNVLAGSKRPPLKKRPDGSKWCIDHFEDGEIRERFGFDSVAELHRVHNILNWPQKIRVGKGDDNKKYNVDGQQPFLYMLERDHCGTKLSLMEFWYGDSYQNSISGTLACG